MENSKLLPAGKARILFLILILILAGSVVFIARSFQKTQDRAYLQTLESLAFNKYLSSPIAYDSVYHLGAWMAISMPEPNINVCWEGNMVSWPTPVQRQTRQ